MIGGRSGERTEFGIWSNNSGKALGSFVLRNIPPEAVEAIEKHVVTPSVNQMLRLAGLEIDDLPPLTIDELIGPTKVRDLPEEAQVLYFSGPQHPILVKARRLDTFITYRDIRAVNTELGVRTEDATVNFKGLARGAFNTSEVATFGCPGDYDFEGVDVDGYRRLDRLAIRRDFARLAMHGKFTPGTSGMHGGNIFNGYGRSLLRGILEGTGRTAQLDLLMHLEQLDEVLAPVNDEKYFDWEATYFDDGGLGYTVQRKRFDRDIFNYIEKLLEEIGIDRDAVIQREQGVTKEVFISCVQALCPLGESHKKSIKRGDACQSGVHAASLTKEAVKNAKVIANILSTEVGRQDNHEDEINLDDPDLATSGSRRSAPVSAAKHEW